MSRHAIAISTSGARPLGKAQQRFNRLSKKIAGLEAKIATWRTREPALQRLLADVRAADHARREGAAAMVVHADRHLRRRDLAPALELALRGFALDLAQDLLADGDWPEVKAIYNRLSGRDYDRDRAAIEAADLEFAQHVLERELGVDFDQSFASMDELRDAALAHAERLDAEDEARRAPRKKTRRQLAAEARKQDQQQQADKALQRVHRALVLALHPDREPDPDERARKTLLMQQANAAYEAGDLLALLRLQLALAQVAPEHLADVADEQLARWNAVLADQVSQLEAALAEVAAPWRALVDVDRAVTPDLVERVLTSERDRAREVLRGLDADLHVFATGEGLRTWLARNLRPAPRPRRR